MLTRREIVGNLAYKDNVQRKVIKRKKQEELTKKRIQLTNSIKVKKHKELMRKIGFIATCFGISFFVVFRSSSLFSMQSELNKINDDINMYEKSNEKLNIEILMKNDINKINKVAIENLHMIEIDKSDIKTINKVNDYFEEPKEKKIGIFKLIEDFFVKF